jgi:hypothetical protein
MTRSLSGSVLVELHAIELEILASKIEQVTHHDFLEHRLSPEAFELQMARVAELRLRARGGE